MASTFQEISNPRTMTIPPICKVLPLLLQIAFREVGRVWKWLSGTRHRQSISYISYSPNSPKRNSPRSRNVQKIQIKWISEARNVGLVWNLGLAPRFTRQRTLRFPGQAVQGLADRTFLTCGCTTGGLDRFE